jgi:hypothetical protein
MDEDIPEFFLCPISQCVMVDPVISVDGFSYERENIERWLREQSNHSSASPIYTSPVTGEVLQSRILIRNNNLAKAIAKFTKNELHLAPSAPTKSVISVDFKLLESLQFSPWSLGNGITLENHRSVAVRAALPADTTDWYTFIAFSAFPARLTSNEKSRALFQVEKMQTGWGGLTIGFSPTAPDRIETAYMKDYIDANAWWLDDSNWFHTPLGGTMLVPWSTSQVKEGDRLGIEVPSRGRVCVYLNGVQKLDIKDTDIPDKKGVQLYAFVALTGGYTRVRVVQDSPQDWGSPQY